MKISYAITVSDELKEIQRLVSILSENKRQEDEIVILLDTGHTSEQVDEYLSSLEDTTRIGEFKGDFSEWKNTLNSYCTGDYIFQLDADEYIEKRLIRILPELIESNPLTELFWFPRINTVTELTQEWIQKWGWIVNEHGYVNFPDNQGRLYKNREGIRWVGKVHERVTGHTSFVMLPPLEEYCIYHPKDLERQIRQNTLYETL